MTHLRTLALLTALSLVACGGKVVVDDPAGAGGSGGTTTVTGTTTGTITTSGTGGGTGIDCDPGKVLCNGVPPDCQPGTVPSVVDSCWGACVPILECTPVSTCAGCTGFCAAYVGWTTEYRCVMPLLLCSSTGCNCVAPYFCASPYAACLPGTPGDAIVTCECTSC